MITFYLKDRAFFSCFPDVWPGYRKWQLVWIEARTNHPDADDIPLTCFRITNITHSVTKDYIYDLETGQMINLIESVHTEMSIRKPILLNALKWIKRKTQKLLGIGFYGRS